MVTKTDAKIVAMAIVMTVDMVVVGFVMITDEEIGMRDLLINI